MQGGLWKESIYIYDSSFCSPLIKVSINFDIVILHTFCFNWKAEVILLGSASVHCVFPQTRFNDDGSWG